MLPGTLRRIPHEAHRSGAIAQPHEVLSTGPVNANSQPVAFSCLVILRVNQTTYHDVAPSVGSPQGVPKRCAKTVSELRVFELLGLLLSAKADSPVCCKYLESARDDGVFGSDDAPWQAGG